MFLRSCEVAGPLLVAGDLRVLGLYGVTMHRGHTLSKKLQGGCFLSLYVTKAMHGSQHQICTQFLWKREWKKEGESKDEKIQTQNVATYLTNFIDKIFGQLIRQLRDTQHRINVYHILKHKKYLFTSI